MAEKDNTIVGAAPNLGSLFAGLSRTIAGVQDKKRERGQKLDIEAVKTYQTISDFEKSQDPFFQDLIFNGLNQAKDVIHNLNQQRKDNEISAAEYKRRVNNISDGQGAITANSLNYDKVVNEGLKRLDEGKLSDLEAIRRQQFAEIAKMKGAEEYIDPTSGEVFLIRRDESGKIISQQNSKRLGGQVGGLNINKVNLPANLDKVLSKWKGNQILKADGSLVVNLPEDKRELFNQGKASLIGELTRTPESVYSILADNGVTESTEYGYIQTYEGYYNEEGKKALIANRLDEAKIALSTPRMAIKKDDKGKNVLENGDVTYDSVPGREMTKQEEDQFIQDQEQFLIEMINNGTQQLVPNTKSKNWVNAKKTAIQTISDQIDLRIGAKRTKPPAKNIPSLFINTSDSKEKLDKSFEYTQLNNYEAMQKAIASKNTNTINSLIKNIPDDGNTFYEWDPRKNNFKVYSRKLGDEFKSYKKYTDNPNNPAFKEQAKGLTTQTVTLDNLRRVIFGKDFMKIMQKQKAQRELDGGNNTNNQNAAP